MVMMKMTMKKLWLDDERPEPEGWVRAKTANVAINYLATGIFGEVSLDHDLGPEIAGTGYQVICWLEERVMTDPHFPVPIVHVHTANASARGRMTHAARNIEMVRQQRIGGR
jgi:hypothetical protein